MKIKEVIELLKTDTDNTLSTLDKETLFKIIKYLATKYYNENVSLVSDEIYDYIQEYYEKTFSTKIKDVGAPIKGKNGKTKLPFYMGSLDKIKPSTNTFDKWIKEYNGPYVISYKLDGISSLLYKKDGKVYMFTRGDGIEGQDISHLIEHIGINISKLVEGDAIRGELVMTKDNFKKIADKMANARNAVSGIINTKKPNPEMLKLIDFVAYWVLSPQMTAEEQLKYIEKKQFVPRTVDYVVKKKISIEELSDMLVKGRKDYKYEIDGIVVIDDSKIYPQEIGQNPSYGFAFKQVLTDQIAESVVVDVIWEISKDKYIKPKIKINTVELLGSEITYATAFNAKYIVDNFIGPGAVVKIIKSGDVIPYIQEVVKKAETPKMPTIKYSWNETKVDILAEDLDEENMNKIIVKKLVYFFATLGIPFMGEGTVQKFVDNGYDDLWKILTADKKDLQKIEGLGMTIINKIYKSINDGLEGRGLAEVMAASQLLGRGIGVKKFKAITDDYPNILEIYKEKGKEHTIKLINSITGFENKTTTKIVDNLDDFISYLNKFLKIKPKLLIKDKEDKKDEDKVSKYNLSKFAGKTLVFTGFRDKDVESELEKLGSKITGSVSKKTDFVIALNVDDESNKIQKAIELEIDLISKERFYDLIKK